MVSFVHKHTRSSTQDLIEAIHKELTNYPSTLSTLNIKILELEETVSKINFDTLFKITQYNNVNLRNNLVA